MFTFGPLKVTPSIVLKSIGNDNNVFNDAENPKQDFTFTLTPRADLSIQPGRMRLSYSTAADYVYYHQYSSERGTNQMSAAQVDFDLGSFRPFASVSGSSSRDRLNSEIDQRARHHQTAVTGGLRTILGTRSTATLSARRQALSYDEDVLFRGQDLAKSLNGTVQSFEGTFGVDITSLTTLSLGVSHDDQQFDVAHERDATTLRVTPSVSFKPAALLNGTFGAGYLRLHGKSPAFPDFTGLTMNGDISMALADRYRLHIGATRDARSSYDRQTPYYVLTGVNGALTTQVSARWDVLAQLRREVLDYQAQLVTGANLGKDNQRGVGVGAGYRVAPRLRVGIQAEWLRRVSERDSSREFSNRRIFTTVTWGLLQ
jgi:hypothetical protein